MHTQHQIVLLASGIRINYIMRIQKEQDAKEHLRLLGVINRMSAILKKRLKRNIPCSI